MLPAVKAHIENTIVYIVHSKVTATTDVHVHSAYTCIYTTIHVHVHVVSLFPTTLPPPAQFRLIILDILSNWSLHIR